MLLTNRQGSPILDGRLKAQTLPLTESAVSDQILELFGILVWTLGDRVR